MKGLFNITTVNKSRRSGKAFIILETVKGNEIRLNVSAIENYRRNDEGGTHIYSKNDDDISVPYDVVESVEEIDTTLRRMGHTIERVREGFD